MPNNSSANPTCLTCNHFKFGQCAKLKKVPDHCPDGLWDQPLSSVGIVIPGGGKFLPQAWVTIKMIRHFKYTNPIELWFLPWENVPAISHFSGLNVSLRKYTGNFCSRTPVQWRDKTIHPAGWQLKVAAALNTNFDKFIVLDADCYPISSTALNALCQHNPTFLQDVPQSKSLLPETTYTSFGLANHPPVDAGAFYIEHGPWTNKILELNTPEMYSSLFYGDKDTWPVACILSGMKPVFLGGATLLTEGAGIDHAIGLIHRTCAKFVTDELENTPQVRITRPLPGDELAVKFFETCPFVRDPRELEFYESVVEQDEYHLASVTGSPQFVVDAGGHVGSFAIAVRKRWPKAIVLAFEPSSANCKRYAANTGIVPRSVALGHIPGKCSLQSDDSCYQTVSGSDVSVVRLSDELDAIGWKRIDLLKLDIESDEHKVILDLVESSWINRIKTIRMEWHDYKQMGAFIELLRKTHHITACFHHWNHGYLEAERNDQSCV